MSGRLARSSALLLVIVACAGAACGSTVTAGGDAGGDGGSGSGGPTGPTGGSPTGGNGAKASAVALFAGEFDDPPCDGGRCAPDDMLVLIADSDGVTCSDPEAPSSTTNPGWSFRIGLPADLQTIGTLSLQPSQGIYVATFNVDGVDDSGVVGVSGGFDVGFAGTLEITAIDAAAVTFRVTDLNLDGRSDGEYVAPRCGVATWSP